ncbi:MAG: DUF4357 domain-containing protein [Bacteroidota bacterium]
MVKLFSIENGVFLNQVQNSEALLNKFISENWKHFFPQYIFIKSEFSLNGIVRTSGSSGRVDILAFNPISNKLVVFELKRDSARNIRDQAGDYRDKIISTLHEIYLRCTQEYDIDLPKYKTLNQDAIEIVLISKRFFPGDIEKVTNYNNGVDITLIKYSWFENNLLMIEYLNNIPSDFIRKSTEHIQTAYLQSGDSIKVSQKEIINPINSQGSRPSVLTLENRDFTAKGREVGNRKEFIVLEGSGISSTITDHISENEKKLRGLYFKNGTVKDGKFTKDVTFTSKSQAAKVLLGYSASGNVVWK